MGLPSRHRRPSRLGGRQAAESEACGRRAVCLARMLSATGSVATESLLPRARYLPRWPLPSPYTAAARMRKPRNTTPAAIPRKPPRPLFRLALAIAAAAPSADPTTSPNSRSAIVRTYCAVAYSTPRATNGVVARGPPGNIRRAGLRKHLGHASFSPWSYGSPQCGHGCVWSSATISPDHSRRTTSCAIYAP
jgi:hypothetical protein